MTTTKLQIAGVTTAFILTIVIYFNIRNRNRDKLATGFIKTLEKHLNISGGTLDAELAFNVNYLDRIKSDFPSSQRIIRLLPDVARRKAYKIKNAWGWNDDEEAVYSVFRGLKDKVQVSDIAKQYIVIDGGISLLDKLKERLNTKERKIVLDIVSALPKYSTA